MDKTRLGGMSATVENAKQKLAKVYEPKKIVIEAGSTHTDIAQRLDEASRQALAEHLSE